MIDTVGNSIGFHGLATTGMRVPVLYEKRLAMASGVWTVLRKWFPARGSYHNMFHDMFVY